MVDVSFAPCHRHRLDTVRIVKNPIAVCRIAQHVERRVTNPCVNGANPFTATYLLVTIKINSIMKQRFEKWMRRNNMTFSAIAGETFTNAEVVYTHIGLVVFLIVLGVAGSL